MVLIKRVKIKKMVIVIFDNKVFDKRFVMCSEKRKGNRKLLFSFFFQVLFCFHLFSRNQNLIHIFFILYNFNFHILGKTHALNTHINTLMRIRYYDAHSLDNNLFLYIKHLQSSFFILGVRINDYIFMTLLF